MIKLLLDTMIYDELEHSPQTLKQLQAAVASGSIDVCITPTIKDQLARGPFGGVPEWFPTSVQADAVFVLDQSKLGEAQLGEGTVYQRHLGESSKRGNVRDAIIAESSTSYADVVVSNDYRFRTRLSCLPGIKVLDFSAFCSWLDKHVA